MNEVILHGELGERFGVLPPLAVRDPAEAMRALGSQLPGFNQIIRKSPWHILVEDPDGKYALDKDEIFFGFGANTRMHIVPALEGAAGAGSKGGVKMILGVALIGASLFVPGMQGFGLGAAKAAWATSIAGTGVTFGHLALAGFALATGGAALMLSPQPAMPSADERPDTNSFVFNGNQSPSGQGMAVPCIWGRFRAVPIPVATRIETNQIFIPGTVGGVVGGDDSFFNNPPGWSEELGVTREAYIWLLFQGVVLGD